MNTGNVCVCVLSGNFRIACIISNCTDILLTDAQAPINVSLKNGIAMATKTVRMVPTNAIATTMTIGRTMLQI